MEISIENVHLIAAMGLNRVIGYNGEIPWKISRDLQRFRELTYGHPVIMGRKTFESIGRPLDGRKNIVVTSKFGYHPTGIVVCHHIESAILAATFEDVNAQIWVIGGASIYKQMLEHVGHFHISFVKLNPQGDVEFPHVEFTDFEVMEHESDIHEEGAPDHSYVHFKRIAA